MFFSKLTDFYFKLEQRVSTLEKIPSDQRMEIEKLKTDLISLRGLVNRKLGKEQEPEKNQQTDFGSGGIFDR